MSDHYRLLFLSSPPFLSALSEAPLPRNVHEMRENAREGLRWEIIPSSLRFLINLRALRPSHTDVTMLIYNESSRSHHEARPA